MKVVRGVVVALALLGCSSVAEPVGLAVRTDNFTPYCHLSYTFGTLVAHAEMGTAIREAGGRTRPVRWPEGFSARRVGGVIEVLNQDGAVIAQTGKHYKFSGGNDDGDVWRGCDGVIPD